MAESSAESDSPTEGELSRTALHDLHLELGARMVPFAGYDMPVQYEGVKSEHLHTRSAAGLFDVGHMGVVDLHGDPAVVAEALESMMPSAFTRLGQGRMRYSFLTNEAGGIIDDLMVSRLPDRFRIVWNASRKDIDLAHARAMIGDRVEIRPRGDLTLVALQGPTAVDVLARLATAGGGAEVEEMVFMDVGTVEITGVPVGISRSGYTGEDGFELAVPVDAAEGIVRSLLAQPEVAPAGLGARDTLRLEAGLCLYGNDLDEATTPVEAGLVWAMQKRRREQGGFPGDATILAQLREGPRRVRVGIRPTGRRPVRDHSSLAAEPGGPPVGTVTSGGFGPTVDAPVAMGYVPTEMSEVGTSLSADVRGRPEEVVVAALPFVPHHYHRGGAAR